MADPTTVVAVVGAGNVGCALAAHLSLQGLEVRLCTRSEERLAPIRGAGAIKITGAVTGVARIAMLTTSLDEAVDGAQIVAVTVPTPALPHYAPALVKAITAEQLIWLNPGHSGGALYLAAEFRRGNDDRELRICQLSTASHGCRMTSSTTVGVFRLTSASLAAFPARHLDECYEQLAALFPGQFNTVSSGLELDLMNINAVMHQAQMVCNASWIQATGGDFHVYQEGTGPAVAQVIEAVDAERLAVAQRLAVSATPFADLMLQSGFTTDEAARTGRVHATLQAGEPIRAVKAPPTLEPLLTGLGAGGYMLVGAPGGDDVLLDFFVEAPGRGGDPPRRAELVPVSIVFGDVVQVFHVGAASVGTYGCPAGICAAHARFASLPLAELVAPAVRLAREGVALNARQTYILELLSPIIASSPQAHALFAKAPPREGQVLRLPDVADGLERLAAEGAAPFYTGEVATAVCDWVGERGGMLSPADLAAYEAVAREPIDIPYRGLRVRTNPPPSAGGILIAAVLAELDREPAPPTRERLVAAMIDAQRTRTAAFMESLHLRGFQEEFLGARRGNTTHISAIDENGWTCTTTVSNGSCSGVVVPGTGLHLNNMLGEADLNPSGFPLHPPGLRLPSMMAPTLLRRADGAVEQRADLGEDGPLAGYRMSDDYLDLVHIEGFSRDCFAWRRRASSLIVPGSGLVERRTDGSALTVLNEVLTWQMTCGLDSPS